MKLSRIVSVGISTAAILLSLSGCATEQANLPLLNVNDTTREFDKAGYEEELAQNRLEDSRVHQSVDGSSDPKAYQPVNEFDMQAYTASLDHRRQIARANDPVVQAGNSFSYGNFLAQMRSTLASQEAAREAQAVIAASSSSSRGSYSGLFGYSEQTTKNSSSNQSSYQYSNSTAPSFDSYNGNSDSVNQSSRSVNTSSTGVTECGDGRDNDNDGRIDAEEDDCHTDGSSSRLSTYDYRLPSESSRTSSSRSSSSQPRLSSAAQYSGSDCNDHSIVPVLSSDPTVGTTGYEIPYVFQGGCPVAGAILPGIGGNDTVFGSMEF